MRFKVLLVDKKTMELVGEYPASDFDEARQIKLGIELNLNKELYQVYIKQEEI